MDIGDIIGLKGYAFKTKMGEISIHVSHLQMLSKSLHPLPSIKPMQMVKHMMHLLIQNNVTDIVM